MYIYIITNRINGKKYVGQTSKTVQARFGRHCWRSSAKRPSPVDIAIQKYGKDSFYVETVCFCSSQGELDNMEIFYAKAINTFCPNGYNLRAGKGRGIVSELTKSRIRLANLGKKVSIETRLKQSESHRGKTQSIQTRLKLSIANRGKAGSALCYKRASEKNQKTYYLLNPSGHQVTIVNMRKFSLSNGLSQFKMCDMYAGNKNHHHGWRRDFIKAPLDNRKKIRPMSFWTLEMDALLGVSQDTVLSKKLGVSRACVWSRRTSQGIAAFKKNMAHKMPLTGSCVRRQSSVGAEEV